MIHYVKGNATEPQLLGRKVIAHIVNDRGKWGKGFVMAVSEKWPVAREAYLAWARGREPEFMAPVTQDPFSLGGNQNVMVDEELVICSMCAQRGINSFGQAKKDRVDYTALEVCCVRLAASAKQFGATVHMPRIGTGLAGGNWDRIEDILNRTLAGAGLGVTVYDLDS